MTQRTILLVDDNPAIRELLVLGLGRVGHRVILAADGAEAILALEKIRFDVVITDVVMPERDGFEVIGAVRRTQPDTRIIVMSGGGKASLEMYLQNARGLGANAVIGKPFVVAELLATIEAVFDGR